MKFLIAMDSCEFFDFCSAGVYAWKNGEVCALKDIEGVKWANMYNVFSSHDVLEIDAYAIPKDLYLFYISDSCENKMLNVEICFYDENKDLMPEILASITKSAFNTCQKHPDRLSGFTVKVKTKLGSNSDIFQSFEELESYLRKKDEGRLIDSEFDDEGIDALRKELGVA